MIENAYFEQMIAKIKECKSNGNKSDYVAGEIVALLNYNDSKRHNSDKFEVTNIPIAQLTDFIETLRKAEITDFVVTAEQTDVIEALHEIQKLGCVVNGLDIVTRIDTEFGVMGTYEVEGIRVSIPKNLKG